MYIHSIALDCIDFGYSDVYKHVLGIWDGNRFFFTYHMTRQAENRGSRVGLMPIGIGVPHRGKGNGLGNFSYIIPQFVLRTGL